MDLRTGVKYLSPPYKPPFAQYTYLYIDFIAHAAFFLERIVTIKGKTEDIKLWAYK
ncbi:hypothetical protein [Sphingobacterium sp. UBA3549]|uniref:hypothetical protein n=1 Tax=Sphingobacterium sp. UBA3549 TaxID=1947496 RepID=UPI0025D7E4E9|nr:hypothetical protein [Sphingobacterium sp. UBA3549]